MQWQMTSYRQVFDPAWAVMLASLSASWVVAGLEKGKGRRGVANRLPDLILLFLLLAALGGICWQTTNRRWFSFAWNLAIGGAGAAYLKLRGRANRQVWYCLWLSMFAGILCLNEVGGRASLLVSSLGIKGTAEALLRILCYLAYIPVAAYLHAMDLRQFSHIPLSGVSQILLGTLAMLGFNIAQILLAIEEPATLGIQMAGYVVIFLMILLGMRSMYSMCMEQLRVASLQAERQRLVGDKQASALVEKNLSDLRSIRHDLKNQYSYMRILLSEDRIDELKVYFEEISHRLPTGLSYVDCGNAVMNTILNMELSKAALAQVPVERQLMVPPVLPFPENDLTSLLANMVDNALEECSRLLEEGKTARIGVEIYPRESYLFLLCRNTTDRKELRHTGHGLRTTKKERELHGYGTQIISRVAERYNGVAEFSLEEGDFVARVILDMQCGA